MNPTLDTIQNLRTIHGNFDNRDINPDELNTILQAATRAACSSNRQVYSVIVLDDRHLMEELCGYQGSRALLFCVDYNRLINLAKRLGHEYNPDGMISFVTGSMDTILAAQTAAIAARSLGIDSLFTNGIHRKNIFHLYDQLHLPEKYCFPLIMLILGYPTIEPGYLRGRLTGNGIFHNGTYKASNDQELDHMIAEYDNPDTHLAMNGNWQDTGCSHYLDWFFKVWTGPNNPAKEEELKKILVRAGFLPG